MVRLAIVCEQVAAQVRALGSDRPRELDNIDIVWSGTSLGDLQSRHRELLPQVLAIDLALLEPPYRPQIDQLLATTGADLVLLLYVFAQREVLRQVTSLRSRPLKLPVSLANLRINMLSLLIKDALSSGSGHFAAVEVPPPALAPNIASPSRVSDSELRGDSGNPLPVGSPRRFSPAQLGRLQQVISSVRCECPNHLSEIVTGLAAFEDYSKSCENRNSSDAAMHARLYRETSRARWLMEEALILLCRHEGIDL